MLLSPPISSKTTWDSGERDGCGPAVWCPATALPWVKLYLSEIRIAADHRGQSHDWRTQLTNDAYAVAKIAGIKQVQALRRQYGVRYISVDAHRLVWPWDLQPSKSNVFLL